ncbi:hypothetical protein GCM10027563_19270 [Parasphingorhabdus pacifica]
MGPISLCAGLLSWIMPGSGVVIALVAVAYGVVSVQTRGPYRVDGTAIAGMGVGSLQVAFSLLLLTMTASGH